MPVNWREHIVSTPDVLRGKPRIKGTRIPVSLILGYLALGNTVEQVLVSFPFSSKSRSMLVLITLAICQILKH